MLSISLTETVPREQNRTAINARAFT
jgi:hypothetical protein